MSERDDGGWAGYEDEEQVVGVMKRCAICERKTMHVDDVCQSHEAIRPASKMRLAEAYAELEIDVGSPEPVVRQARNILLRVWHPDRHQNDAKLCDAAEKKTRRVNAAFTAIEAAMFPSAAEVPQLDEERAPSIDHVLKAREIELREREVAVKERLASKPTTTEWIDQKARSLFRTLLILGCIAGLLVLAVVGFVIVNESNRRAGGWNSDEQALIIGVIVGASVLLGILRALLKRR